MATWYFSLGLSPWNNKLNIYNSTKNTQPAHKYIWEIWASKHQKVGITQIWGVDWEKQRNYHSQLELPVGRGEGEISWSVPWTVLSEWSANSTQQNPRIGQGMEWGWVWRGGSCVLVVTVAKQEVESQSLVTNLPHHPRVCPPFTPYPLRASTTKSQRNLHNR